MITLTIPDMTCGHCKASVEGAIRALDAAATVSVDLPSHTAQVNSSAAPAAILAALSAVGFEATPA